MKWDKLSKDDSIINVLKAISTSLGNEKFDIVDHWDADMCAIGISKLSDKDKLVYISTYEKEDGIYYYELEYPASEKKVTLTEKQTLMI